MGANWMRARATLAGSMVTGADVAEGACEDAGGAVGAGMVGDGCVPVCPEAAAMSGAVG